MVYTREGLLENDDHRTKWSSRNDAETHAEYDDAGFAESFRGL